MTLNNDILAKISKLPDNRLAELLAFIEFLNYKQEHSPKFPKQYDFSDLSGRLQWQGNALQEQKRLRDEW